MALATSHLSYAQNYEYTNSQLSVGAGSTARANDVNSFGVVTGAVDFNTGTSPAAWRAGSLQQLSSPNVQSNGAGISELGNIVGTTFNNSVPEAYLYDAKLGLKSLQSLLHYGPTFIGSYGTGIAGNFITGYVTEGTNVLHARGFLYDISSGSVKFIEPAPGDYQVMTTGVNSNGTVIGITVGNANGQRGFVYDPQNGLQVLNLSGASAAPYGINDRGDIVGYAKNSSGAYQGFVRMAGPGSIQFIGTLNTGDRSVALAINNDGTVVGANFSTSCNSWTSISNGSCAVLPVLWDSQRHLRQVNPLVGQNPPGLGYLTSVSDCGHIVGSPSFLNQPPFELTPVNMSTECMKKSKLRKTP